MYFNGIPIGSGHLRFDACTHIQQCIALNSATVKSNYVHIGFSVHKLKFVLAWPFCAHTHTHAGATGHLSSHFQEETSRFGKHTRNHSERQKESRKPQKDEAHVKILSFASASHSVETARLRGVVCRHTSKLFCTKHAIVINIWWKHTFAKFVNWKFPLSHFEVKRVTCTHVNLIRSCLKDTMDSGKVPIHRLHIRI